MDSLTADFSSLEVGNDLTTLSDSGTSTSPVVQDTCTRYKNREYYFESEQMMCVCVCVLYGV